MTIFGTSKKFDMPYKEAAKFLVWGRLYTVMYKNTIFETLCCESIQYGDIHETLFVDIGSGHIYGIVIHNDFMFDQTDELEKEMSEDIPPMIMGS